MALPKVIKERLGKQGEAAVRDYLCTEGFETLAENWRYSRLGELDLVMRDGEVLVFVEVKTRLNRNYGSPLEAINERKQTQLLMLAEAFIAAHPEFSTTNVRFDIATVEPNRVGAFDIEYFKNVLD